MLIAFLLSPGKSCVLALLPHVAPVGERDEVAPSQPVESVAGPIDVPGSQVTGDGESGEVLGSEFVGVSFAESGVDGGDVAGGLLVGSTSGSSVPIWFHPRPSQ